MINFEIARAHACARVLACKTAFFKNSARARAARVLGVRVPRAHAFRTRRGRTLGSIIYNFKSRHRGGEDFN